MIALGSDFLLFQMAGGESVPFSAEMLSVELMGDSSELFDTEFLHHAAHAVFHYFKRDLGRQTVSVGEFAEALETVLRGFKPPPRPANTEAPDASHVGEFDLSRLAVESGPGCELFFFPNLRDELRRQLSQSPTVLRFGGLRGCVKRLAGTRRWSPRCRNLEERIVDFLRQCLGAEAGRNEFGLVVK